MNPISWYSTKIISPYLNTHLEGPMNNIVCNAAPRGSITATSLPVVEENGFCISNGHKLDHEFVLQPLVGPG